ncbi:uncharacterized protein LOC133722349 [Rosa rugosa]|uniref:uncharacterized protein LOC133722349 n=1 Tax=Rosa rugosa TaxID=74645 RepID=UPI002B416B7D|nr:uncharacterized protein LOC133722349 [Rosa rugosa]XP_062005229.1 uncharacterized protein LOC133722349 [Rosa rugosa]
MESGEYEHSPWLFSDDMQKVWSKLLGFGTELVPLSKSLSDMSATCKEESQVQGSIYNTFEGGYNEIFLQEILTVLSQWPDEPRRLVLMLVNFLNLVLEDAEIDLDDEDAKITAFECLTKIDEFLSSSSLDEGTIEALLFELPKKVALFGGVSDKCVEVAKSILDQFASRFGAERLAVCGKEPVDRVRHNSCHEQVNLQISNSGDCSERDLMIPILKQMYQSIGNDEGGVQVCIREAIQHFQEIDHRLPKESSEYIEDVVSDESSKHCTVTAMC